MRNPAVIAMLLASSTVQAWPWSDDKEKEIEDDINKITHSKAFLITKGVLRGTLHAEGFDDFERCFDDAKDIVHDIEAAYGDFKKGHVDDVIAGVHQVGSGLKSLKKALTDCNFKGDLEKLEHMGAIFASPMSFAYHVGKDLVVNGEDIFNEIRTAITDYESGNWEDFGYNVGEAAAQVLLGGDSQMMLMAMGAPELGATQGGEGENDLAIFRNAWALSIREEMEQNPADEQLRGGMSKVKVVDWSENSELNHQLASFQTMIEEKLGKQYGKFIPVKYTMQTVKGLMYRVEYSADNNTSVYAKIVVPPTEQSESEPFVMDVQEEEKTSGLQAPEPMLTITQDGAEQLMMGLIDAFLQKENMGEVATCIKDTESAAKKVTDIIHDFKKHSIQGTIDGVKAAGALLQELPDDAEACGGMKDDIARLKEFVKLLKKPMSFVKTVTGNLGKNHTQIFSDVSAAVTSYEGKDFKQAGQDIADIMVLTLGEFPKPQAPESLEVTQW